MRRLVNVKNQTVIQSAILVAIPVVFIGISLFFRYQRGPYWLFSNSDPEYAYLLNSLNVIQSNPLGHTEHPGTLLHLSGAFIITAAYFFQKIADLVDSTIIEAVLREPELYLQIINSTILILTGVSIFLVGRSVLILSKSLFLALIIQIPCFLATALASAYRVSPEPLLFLISQALAIILLFYIYEPAFERSNKFPILLGIIFGLGVASKYTFLPTLLFILLVPTIKQKLITIGVSIVTFVISTSPIIAQYPKTFSWIYGAIVNKGYYGSTGEPGFVDLVTAQTNFQFLLNQDKIFFGLLFISLFVFILLGFLIKIWNLNSFVIDETNFSIVRKSYILLAFFLLISFVQIVPILKQPSVHYLVSLVSLSGLIVSIQINLIQNIIKKFFSGFKLKIFPALCLILCVAIAVLSTKTHSDALLNQYNLYQQELGDLQSLVNHRYRECAQISYYRSSSQEYALKFGDFFALGSFSHPLQKLYPNSYFYNIWSRQYESFNQPIDIKTFLNTQCAILRGTPLSLPQYEPYIPTLNLETVFESSSEAVYRIISAE